jgi:hypothetical protein
MGNRPFFSIIIPTYNRCDNLSFVYKKYWHKLIGTLRLLYVIMRQQTIPKKNAILLKIKELDIIGILTISGSRIIYIEG